MTQIPLDISKVKEEKEPKINPKTMNWIITLGLIVLLLIVTLPLRGILDSTSLILVYTLVVLVISNLTTGHFYGFFSAIVCTSLFDYFINYPQNAFEFSIKFPITLFIMLAVSLANSAITAHLKDILTLSKKREEQTLVINEIFQELVDSTDEKDIVNIANQNLAAHLKRSVIFYLGEPSEANSYVTSFPKDLNPQAFKEIYEVRSAKYAFEEGRPAGYGTNYNGDREVYYAPINSDVDYGVVGISCHNKPLKEDDYDFIKLVLSQVLLALERQHSQRQQQESKFETEREKMRNNLLRSVSHDLRTPLTSILGASETLLDDSIEFDRKERKNLICKIKEEAQWLSRIVENLLAVTRISDEKTYIKTVPEMAEEVIEQAVRNIQKWYPDWSIHVKTPKEPIFIPMDATLISQVLINLLENAIKHSSPDDLIFVNLKEEDNYALFEVSDNGSGISEDLLENLFDTPVTGASRSIDSSSGAGIGLSICSSIIRAHGGNISGKNKESGGATFSFKLPLLKEEDKNEAEKENPNN
ncbi:ATP-binding protein [Anaerosphaera multitolerans]|uniref:histidine kinase n=1 Tax=Anaerosphaera multitolerans TaxID=2487351 RepID=A0A437S5Q6_9FIRM|nr:ATP-binding protein [Anaerosphaera multitolerans]RVU54363.1 DUF4118 domain-containing protein [Anaerosphaera multitolerans]